MRPSILTIVLFYSIIGNCFSQEPSIKAIKVSQKPLFSGEGNCYNPHWSYQMDWLGADFNDKILNSVVVYSLKLNRFLIYNVQVQENRKIPSRRPPQMTPVKSNTENIQFSPITDNDFYVISSLNKKYDLYWVQNFQINLQPRVGALTYNNRINPELLNKHISYSTFIKIPRDRGVGIFTAGDESESNIWLYDENNDHISKVTRNNNIRAYESQMYVDDEDLLNIVYKGIELLHSDIYLIQSINIYNLKNTHQVLKNITNTSDAIEQLPKWSPNGKKIAYLSTLGHEDLSNYDPKSEMSYALYIYNVNDKVNYEVYYPVLLDATREMQSTYCWFDNNTIILIDKNLEKKQPLIAVNVNSKIWVDLQSPLYHHQDIEISPDFKKLAIIARGHKNDRQIGFSKIYIAEL